MNAYCSKKLSTLLINKFNMLASYINKQWNKRRKMTLFLKTIYCSDEEK